MATLYEDPLITITDEAIVVRCYSLLGRDARVPWADVQSVRALTPTLTNGKWRLWGTGTFATWFACDFDRPARQTIFKMKRHSRPMKIGFTVHDALKVKQLIAEHNLLINEQGETPPPADLPPVPRESMWHFPAVYALALLAVLFVIETIHYYPLLPPTVASHFDINGHPNDYASRGLLTGSMLAAAALVTSIFLLIARMLSRTAASPAGRLILWHGVATLGLMLWITHLAYRANLSPSQSIGTAPLYALTAYLAFTAIGLTIFLRRLAARA